MVLSPLGLLAADKDEKLNLYPLVKGHKWEYESKVGDRKIPLTMELTDVTRPDKEGGPVLFSLTTVNNRESSLDLLAEDAKGVYRHSSGKERYAVPIPIIKYPAKAGRWTQKLTVANKEVEATFEMKEAEEVTVPAGKYMAYPVVYKAQAIESTSWYADGVGLVKMELKRGGGTATLELTKFTPVKKEK
jgi:hypothetical protein